MRHLYFTLRLLVFVSVFIFCFSSADGVFAHGTAQSFPKDIGQYTVELEYDALGIFDDTTEPLVFRLLDQKSKEPVKFSALLVRLERKDDKSTTFVVRLSPDDFLDGVGRMTAMLNRGDYLITLIFYGGENRLVEAEYDLTVQKGSASDFPVIPVVSGVLGAVAGFVVGRLKKTSHEK